MSYSKLRVSESRGNLFTLPNGSNLSKIASKRGQWKTCFLIAERE